MNEGRLLGKLYLWAGRVFGGYHRLEKLKMVALESPISDAISLYGPRSNPAWKKGFLKRRNTFSRQAPITKQWSTSGGG